MNTLLIVLMWWPVAAFLVVAAFVVMMEWPRWFPVVARAVIARAELAREYRAELVDAGVIGVRTVTETAELRYLLEPYQNAAAVSKAAG